MHIPIQVRIQSMRLNDFDISTRNIGNCVRRLTSLPFPEIMILGRNDKNKQKSNIYFHYLCVRLVENTFL